MADNLAQILAGIGQRGIGAENAPTQGPFGRISEALTGFGERGMGLGPQRRAEEEARRERSKALTKERQLAGLQDGREALIDLKAGRPDRALARFQSRVDLLGQDPGASSDGSQQIIDLIQGGDINSAISELQLTEDEAVRRGLIPALPGAEILKKGEITKGFVVERLPGGGFRKTRVLEQADVGGDEGKFSAVTKVFDNGTTIQAGPGGTTTVRGPSGEVLTGEDRLTALKTAREEQISFAAAKAGETQAAKTAIDLSTKTFERLEPIQTAIGNINDAIASIDAGAKTGTIVSRLPSVRSASKRLDNIQGRLGLDVIGNTTFGALSEAELQFALSTALPKNLAPKDLRRWLTDKRDAQQKLSAYLEDVAIFLGTPGNTVAGWLEAQRTLEPEADQGQVVEVDF